MPFGSLNSHYSDASNSSSNTYNTAAGLTLLGSPSFQSLSSNSTAQTNERQLLMTRIDWQHNIVPLG